MLLALPAKEDPGNSMGLLENQLATSANHRVCSEIAPKHLDKNIGQFVIAWGDNRSFKYGRFNFADSRRSGLPCRAREKLVGQIA